MKYLTKYIILVSFISLLITGIIMKLIRQSSQNLLIDLLIYIGVAFLLTIILMLINTNIRKLLMNK